MVQRSSKENTSSGSQSAKLVFLFYFFIFATVCVFCFNGKYHLNHHDSL